MQEYILSAVVEQEDDQHPAAGKLSPYSKLQLQLQPIYMKVGQFESYIIDDRPKRSIVTWCVFKFWRPSRIHKHIPFGSVLKFFVHFFITF